MDRHEYLSALKERLAALPAEELQRTMEYYEEMISDFMEEGMSEDQAVAMLEPVDIVAAKILAESPSKPDRTRNVLTIALIALGSPVWLSVLIAVAAVVFSIYAVVWAVILSVWAVVVSLIGGGLMAAVAGPFQAASQGAIGWYTMGAGMIITGAGLMLIKPSALLTCWTGKGSFRGLRWMWNKLSVRRKGI